MAIQKSVVVRIAGLDSLETAIGSAPLLKIRTGAPPANCATADAGTALVSITLPADWMAGASAAGNVVTKVKAGTWQGTATAGGTAAHFRIYDSSGTTCHLQGTVTDNLGSGDMKVDNTNIQPSQTVTVNTVQLTAGNA